MKGKRILYFLQALFCGAIAAITYVQITALWKWPVLLTAGAFFLLFLLLAFSKQEKKGQEERKRARERFGSEKKSYALVLLSEAQTEVARWDLYGKTGLVLGRDVGENQVEINLEQSEYASLLDVEHACLNYTAGYWYVEDLYSKNGVSVQKSDGKKYKLAPGKPCKLERGDLLFLAKTNLLLI